MHRIIYLIKYIILGLGFSLMVHTLAQNAQTNNVRLVILGSKGGPAVMQTQHFAQSSVLLVNDRAYLIDAGYGASLRLVEAGIPLRKLSGIFLTHLHSDHMADYPALLINAWSSGLRTPVAVWGPKGTISMNAAVWQTFSRDVELRIADEGKPDPRPLFQVNEYQAGVVFENKDLKVTAMTVPHPPFDLGETVAFKIEVVGKTIVFSGDTNYYEPLAEFAKDADILVHEIAYLEAIRTSAARAMPASPEKQERFAQAIMSHHLSAEEVGKIAALANPKKLVLSHLVPADDPTLTDAVWTAAVRQHFSGPVIVGHDGMDIPLD